MSGRIDLLAHERHFFDHLLPMFLAVPAEHRGSIITRTTLGPHVQGLVAGVIDPPNIVTYASRGHVPRLLRKGRNLVLCSASGDLLIAHKAQRMAVFTQHGAGQSFTKKSPSYAGWPNHKNVALFLHPGPNPAGKDAAIYGEDSVRIIGCPKMDPWHRGEIRKRAAGKLPVVAFSTHWDCKVIQETRSAFWHQLPGLDALSKLNGKEIRLLGHGHPRMLGSIREEYRKRGIEVVEKFSDVMERADLYVMDHMSTLFEFASAGEGGDGRPVVVMNCPHYRKAVNHGLRWWEASGVGINVDDPADMVAAVRRALEDRPEQREKRRQAVDLCYAYADGRASERAGEAITETIRRLSGRVSVPIGSGRVYQPLLNGSIPNPNGHKKYSAQKWATMRTSYFDRNQVALRAVNRLRNFNRGYTPRGSGVDRGINALRGRVFFTDEQHAKELIQQGQAEYAPDVHFPGTEPALLEVEPIEELTEADVPEVICSHTGHGYYDVVFDGHVKGRERGKKAAELAAKKLVEDWKRENLPQEDDMVNA